jgi:DNA-directed RNA polymerase subunit RPC12/RpoP
MPYPHCDQSCQNKPVSNASDNIKLKILEDKLRNDLVQKDLTDLPEVSEIKSSDYLYVYDSEQEQVKKISANEILNQVDLEDYAKKSDLFSGNYEDLSNKPIIPSIEGLATEEFVKEEIKNSGHMTIANLQIGIDFITDIKVGYLDAGFEVKATMTFGELLKRILRCEHKWLDATCTTPKTCSLCGKTEGEALGHIEEIIEGKEATCEETGLTDGVRCARCGDILVKQQVIPALGHNYVSEVIKSATCIEEGLRKYTCTRCGDTYEEVITVISHKQANREENRIEPDCTNSGSYDKVIYCIDCGEVLNRETIVLSALGHDYGD